MFPVDDIRKEIIKRSFRRLFDDVLGYLNLYDYLKLKAIQAAAKSKSISLDSFWFSILGERSSLRGAASFFLRELAAVKIDHASQNPVEIDFRRKAYLLIRL